MIILSAITVIIYDRKQNDTIEQLTTTLKSSTDENNHLKGQIQNLKNIIQQSPDTVNENYHLKGQIQNLENIIQQSADPLNENYQLKNQIQDLTKQIQDLKNQNDYLEHIKQADESIFNFIRCINIPRTPACRTINESNQKICRSKQIDCNKLKLVLENDPVTVDRMKIATEQYFKPGNASELTQPVKSGWMF
jgi:cell division protein FtsB